MTEKDPVQCEMEYRRKHLRQLLEGEVYFTDHGDASTEEGFERYHQSYMAPQCALLAWMISWIEESLAIKVRNGLEPFLELGAFTGHLSGFLSTNYKISGTCSDLEIDVVRMATEHFFGKLGLCDEGIEYQSVDAQKMPFEDNSFRFVFAFSATHHFENLPQAISEVYRVLKPGGVFLCAQEPLQPLLRGDRTPYDRTEIAEGLIEHVFKLRQTNQLFRNVFTTVYPMPYLQIKGHYIGKLVNQYLPRQARYMLANLFGGVDYSIICQK